MRSKITIEQWLNESTLPLPEKRALVCHVTKLSQVQTITHGDQRLWKKDLQRLNELEAERKTGMPIPYLTGEQEFFSHPFKVNPDVMIPRPDTECLVEWMIENVPEDSTVIDLGTGSGCIAISFALERDDCEMLATDISPEALAIAAKNAKTLGAKVKFGQGSWLDAVPFERKLDVIVANPPYIEPKDEHLQALRFEPLDALTDHNDGLDCIRTIVKQAQSRILTLKALAIEHGWDQGAAVRTIFTENGFAMPTTLQDYAGNDRFTIWQRLLRFEDSDFEPD
ncbi:MAG: peptide chain release factor N(5)-glutamine methyltransferase [Burkholderiales bacterium]|nr:peptide chain release factor N(5)-glutamine methyltransferase [Burkholderiales bacterium]